MADYQIHQGNCLAVLKTLESESVQCCVTSPPYLGLRDYGTEPQIWDGVEDCEHSWIETVKPAANGIVKSKMQGITLSENSATRGPQVSDFCSSCGAWKGHLGLEPSPQLFIQHLTTIFNEVRRVLRKDGTLFLNIGDSYAGSGRGRDGDGSVGKITSTKQRSNTGAQFNVGRVVNEHSLSKNLIENGAIGNAWVRPPKGFKRKELMMIPARVAIALSGSGWCLRSEIPWVKRSAMPESVTDRPAKSLEFVYMFSRSAKYFFDMFPIKKRMADSSIERLSQHMDAQAGSLRVPGKTNGAMKAVGNWKGSSFSKGKTAEHQLNRSQKDRDRSLSTNRNGITGSLDETAAGSRHFRNSDLWFQSIKEPHGLVGIGDEIVGLDVNPAGFKDAHYATFPERLPEPFILAGTSEYGACAGTSCGKPYRRIVDKELPETRETVSAGPYGGHGLLGGNRFDEPIQTQTIGWQKPCKCETDEVKPCVVLDPFSGAGTTLLVALKNNRRAIGIELLPENVEMTKRRLKNVQVKLF